jgi:hypothetical protein
VVLQAISNAGRNCATQERSKCSTAIADTLGVHGRPAGVYVGDRVLLQLCLELCSRQLSFSRAVRKAQPRKLMRVVFTVPVTVGCDGQRTAALDRRLYTWYIGAGPGRLFFVLSVLQCPYNEPRVKGTGDKRLSSLLRHLRPGSLSPRTSARLGLSYAKQNVLIIHVKSFYSKTLSRPRSAGRRPGPPS